MALIDLQFSTESITKADDVSSAFLYVNTEYVQKDPERSHHHNEYKERVFLVSEEKYQSLATKINAYKRRIFPNEDDENFLNLEINSILGSAACERHVRFSRGKAAESDSDSSTLDMTKLLTQTDGDGKRLVLFVESSSSAVSSRVSLRVPSPILFVLLKEDEAAAEADNAVLKLIQSIRERSKRNALPGNNNNKNAESWSKDDYDYDDGDDADLSQNTICRRVSLKVNFEHWGWWNDWLLSPHVLDLYRCVGACPFPLGKDLNGTNYSLLTSMMAGTTGGSDDGPSPCCVPVSYRPVSLLYLDSFKNVVLQQYNDMVIEGCGCR